MSPGRSTSIGAARASRGTIPARAARAAAGARHARGAPRAQAARFRSRSGRVVELSSIALRPAHVAPERGARCFRRVDASELPALPQDGDRSGLAAVGIYCRGWDDARRCHVGLGAPHRQAAPLDSGDHSTPISRARAGAPGERRQPAAAAAREVRARVPLFTARTRSTSATKAPSRRAPDATRAASAASPNSPTTGLRPRMNAWTGRRKRSKWRASASTPEGGGARTMVLRPGVRGRARSPGPRDRASDPEDPRGDAPRLDHIHSMAPSRRI